MRGGSATRRESTTRILKIAGILVAGGVVLQCVESGALAERVAAAPMIDRWLATVLLSVVFTLFAAVTPQAFVSDRAISLPSVLVGLPGVVALSVISLSAFFCLRSVFHSWAGKDDLFLASMTIIPLFHLVVFASVLVGTASWLNFFRTGHFLDSGGRRTRFRLFL